MSTVAELLQYSMAFCGRSDVAEKYYLGELDEGGTTLKNCLLFCYNVVADDLVRHHFPMKITEFFTTTDKKIALSNFRPRLLKIEKVLDERENKVPFEVVGENITLCKNGKFKITYHILPETQLDDEECNLPKVISDTLIVYAIVREYYLIMCEYEKAKLFSTYVERELALCLNDAGLKFDISRRAFI